MNFLYTQWFLFHIMYFYIWGKSGNMSIAGNMGTPHFSVKKSLKCYLLHVDVQFIMSSACVHITWSGNEKTVRDEAVQIFCVLSLKSLPSTQRHSVSSKTYNSFQNLAQQKIQIIVSKQDAVEEGIVAVVIWSQNELKGISLG